MTLQATSKPSGAGIDPQVGDPTALKKPPFSAYNSYSFLSRSTSTISKQTPASIALPNGGTLQPSLKDSLPGNQFRIAATLKQPGGAGFAPLAEVTATAGAPLFVAGPGFQGGILVFRIAALK
jgi:hypothetical protein